MTYALQVSIPYFTNIPQDVVTNVWHFDWGIGGGPGASDYAALENVVKGFYQGTFSSITLAAMAPWMLPAQTKMKVYNLDDPIPRVPVHQATVPLTVSQAASATTAPEVALALSYQADPVSGVPQARRRGRIFVGGIGLASNNGTTTSFPTPTSTILTAMANGAAALGPAAFAVNWLWVVYSRVLGTSAIVSNGWVDNAFDTQRRRGNTASARTLWT